MKINEKYCIWDLKRCSSFKIHQKLNVTKFGTCAVFALYGTCALFALKKVPETEVLNQSHIENPTKMTKNENNWKILHLGPQKIFIFQNPSKTQFCQIWHLCPFRSKVFNYTQTCFTVHLVLQSDNPYPYQWQAYHDVSLLSNPPPHQNVRLLLDPHPGRMHEPRLNLKIHVGII